MQIFQRYRFWWHTLFLLFQGFNRKIQAQDFLVFLAVITARKSISIAVNPSLGLQQPHGSSSAFKQISIQHLAQNMGWVYDTGHGKCVCLLLTRWEITWAARMKRTERNPWYQRNFCSRAQAHPYVSLRVVHEHCYFYSSFFLWKKKFVSYLRNCDKALSMGQQIYLSLSFLLVWEIICTFMNDFQCVVAKPKFSAVSNQIPNYQVSLSLSLFSSASVLSWISMGTGLGPWLSDFRAVHLFFFLISCLFPPYAYYKIFVTSSLQLKARFVFWLLANGGFVWKVV